ncbi:MAG: hypothetical protein K0R11_278 [Acidimicrobiales bacterium]|nr:hypothetical protein [Acidimicrobiales bacterium]
MAARSEPRFLVLHGLRVKGFAGTADVAAVAGLDGEAAEQLLRGLADQGLVRWKEGRLPPWSLTPDGRAEHQRSVSDELEAAGAKAVVDGAYQRFLVLNRELLEVCTAWQLRTDGVTQVPNDHSDAAHDRAVVERLEAVDGAAQQLIDELTGSLERFGAYGPRLRTALQRVRAGDGDWITKPTVDSYHTVWMELHEDLMATLGIQRGEGT